MKKILLIEDNQSVRENTAEILELANYEVLTAENGRAGVDVAQKNLVDLIICDIMMPELDGYGVLHVLNKNHATASIPFIFLTAKAERADYRKGMNLGADDYLTKPFDDVELLDAVESRLKKTEILKIEFSQNIDGLNKFLKEARGLEDLKKLSEGRKIRIYKKKNNIFLEGDLPFGVFFINRGRVKTYKTNEDGKEFITGLHHNGDFVGFESLLEGSHYKESATAMEESELVIIYKDDFFSLLYSNRDVARKFIKMLSNKVVEKEEQLLNLAYNSVRQRTAEALLTLKEKYQTSDQEVFSISISREDLANMVGTATESVIRMLSDIKEEKVIDINGSKITLLDPDKLSKIINWRF